MIALLRIFGIFLVLMLILVGLILPPIFDPGSLRTFIFALYAVEFVIYFVVILSVLVYMLLLLKNILQALAKK